MVTLDGGATIKHCIISLNVDTGDINPGWPVDVEATVSYNGVNFIPAIQQQRAALGIVGNILYVPYGSMRDCNHFHGWLVGVPINNPASVTAWAATPFDGGGIWAVGGVASDDTNPFVTTGNTTGTGGNWSGGEAVIRFQPGPIFSGNLAITGRLPIGSNWIKSALRSVALVRCWWTCRARLHPASLSRWARMATHTCLIGTIWVGSARRWHRRMFQIT